MKRGKKLFKAGVVFSLCAAMSVSVLPKQISAKTKFSVPKTTVISYDKGNSGANDWFTNVIWINGTSSWKTAGKVERGMKSFKSSKKKVISKMAPVYTETRKDQKVGLGVRVKRTGTSTVTFKIKYKGKTYKRKTKVKVIKYQNPFQKIMIDGSDYTFSYKKKQQRNMTTLGESFSLTPNKNWKVKSLHTYRYGKVKKVSVKKNSFRIPKGYRATLLMQNKKTKVCEEIMLENYNG